MGICYTNPDTVLATNPGAQMLDAAVRRNSSASLVESPVFPHILASRISSGYGTMWPYAARGSLNPPNPRPQRSFRPLCRVEERLMDRPWSRSLTVGLLGKEPADGSWHEAHKHGRISGLELTGRTPQEIRSAQHNCEHIPSALCETWRPSTGGIG